MTPLIAATAWSQTVKLDCFSCRSGFYAEHFTPPLYILIFVSAVPAVWLLLIWGRRNWNLALFVISVVWAVFLRLGADALEPMVTRTWPSE